MHFPEHDAQSVTTDRALIRENSGPTVTIYVVTWSVETPSVRALVLVHCEQLKRRVYGFCRDE